MSCSWKQRTAPDKVPTHDWLAFLTSRLQVRRTIHSATPLDVYKSMTWIYDSGFQLLESCQYKKMNFNPCDEFGYVYNSCHVTVVICIIIVI